MGPHSFKFVFRFSIITERQLLQVRCGSGGKSERNRTGLGDGDKGGSSNCSFIVDVDVSDAHGKIVAIWDDSAVIDLCMILEEGSPCDYFFFFVGSL